MFGIGASESKSGSQQTSDSSSFGFNVSDSASNSVSSSQSTGNSQSSQSVFGAPVFQNLFANASDAAAGVNTGAVTDAANSLFNGGASFLDSLGGGGAGADYLSGRINGDDGVLGSQINALGGDLSKFFNETLLPGINTKAIGTGTFGGSRQGVAQGVAAGQVAGQFTQGVAQLRTADQAQKDAAATSLLSNNTQAAGIGLNALPGLFQIAQGGATAGLAPYQALSAILGGPTVLGESSSTQSSTSDALAQAISKAIGQDSSQSSSQGTSDSSSFGFHV